MTELLDKERERTRTKRVLKSFSLLFLIYVFFMLNWWFEVFRLKYPPSNYIFFLAVLAIPFILMALSFWFPKWWMKIVGVLVMLPFIINSFQWGSLTLLVLPDVIKSGDHVFWRKTQTLHMPYYEVSIYEYDYSVTVRQEKEIFPGVLLVRDIHHNASFINVDVVDENQIKIEIPEWHNGSIETRTETITLKRFVYF